MQSGISQGGLVNFSIDRGGTFTDVYAHHGETVYREKLLSHDPANYPDAPGEGIRRILERIHGRPLTAGSIPEENIGWIRMGTTLATNALLERSGTDCALVITRGFRDLLRIGYQNRPGLFALNIIRPELLYREVVEIEERVRPWHEIYDPGSRTVQTGTGGEAFAVLQRPDPGKVREQLVRLHAMGIRSLAVVLMHGYSFTGHEQLVGSIARSVGFEQVSLSHEVMPRIKIVARGDTCCVDAYLTPHIRQYISEFRKNFAGGLRRTPLYFMQSDGGLTEADAFKGYNAILSGPAGGVVGYARTTFRRMGNRPVIGFDMGGTSTDVSRYNGELELVHETETAGVRIQAPQIDIRTVAAGGGSRLFYRNGLFRVGPESAGAHPGPVCYRKGGYLSVTDANLLLGRLQPDYFPRIFGPGEDMPLDLEAVRREFSGLAAMINSDPDNPNSRELTPEETAQGFLDVANEVMVRPIREVSIVRGYNVREHILACFGGAGGQHAVAIARKLGISEIFIHRDAGILSALGIGAADVIVDRQEPAGAVELETSRDSLLRRLRRLAGRTASELSNKGWPPESVSCTSYLNLRYEGTDTSFMIREPEDRDYRRAMSQRYRREFGFDLESRGLLVDDLRARAVAALPFAEKRQPPKEDPGEPREYTRCYFSGAWHQTPVYRVDDLGTGQRVTGPALIMQQTSTIVVEPFSTAVISEYGDIVINVEANLPPEIAAGPDPIRLAIFSNRFMSIAEQMGRVLQKTALSTNIKERLDFSCAIFDDQGGLVANAPHVPVHLGAMSEAVKKQIELRGSSLEPGDVLVSNHPAAGGSHLPDITVITPVWKNGSIRFFVASRGHHSDVGGISPGSMPPFSRTVDEEGLHIKSFKMIAKECFREQQLRGVLTSGKFPVRDPETVITDLKAQSAANQRGIDLLLSLMREASEEVVMAYMRHIQDNAESAVRQMLKKLAASLVRVQPGKSLHAEDMLDTGSRIRLAMTINPDNGSAVLDFNGTSHEMWGNLNAPFAVTQSAILYALRCLIAEDIPLNQGCLRPITIRLPENSLLHPSEHAAVAGGNVLTSQRIVDVILRAAEAAAASQGCMNNLAFGDRTFAYYETIGGGAGAGPGWHGCSGVHTHMTNTRITDPEILEHRYPVMLGEFSLRRGSGGRGRYRGGDGIVREIQFLAPLQVTILSERRVFRPYGMQGGEPGRRGKNIFISADGRRIDLGSRNEIPAASGDSIRILTPGGGGWGIPEDR
jgi:5-oxoprolinase (ATP-hydrolysing)